MRSSKKILTKELASDGGKGWGCSRLWEGYRQMLRMHLMACRFQPCKPDKIKNVNSICAFISHLKCSLDTYVTYHLGSKVTSCGNATIDQTKFCLYLHIFVYIYNIYTSFDFGTICLILPLSSSYNSTQNLPLCIPLSLILVSTLL